MPLPQLFDRPSWWWVFALFIALPAVALALLGLSAIRADELERQARLRDQQAQIARLADVALATALDREVADAHGALSDGSHRGVKQTNDPSSSTLSTVFEIDSRNRMSFPGLRLFVAPIDADPLPEASLAIPADVQLLIDRAQAAEARGRPKEAAALYERLQSFTNLRDWAALQLAIRADPVQPAFLLRVADPRLAVSDARTPSGIPLAVVASSLSETVEPHLRRRFTPLIEQTLGSLRAGGWWLGLEQRRAYDAELRQWLLEADPHRTPNAEDERIDRIDALARTIRATFDESRQLPPRAQVTGTSEARFLLVWTRPTMSTQSWSGVAVSEERAVRIFAAALDPLLEGQPFPAALFDRHGPLWGTPTQQGRRASLETLPEWALEFGPASPLPGTDWTRVLNYARVAFPILVLACGLLMTARIVRRELALATLQSTFIASVTHEFKSPITSIRLLMERLAGGRIAPGDSPRRYFDAITVETDRLEGLVNRLLEAQKVQTGQREYAFRPAAIEPLVQDAVNRMRTQAEARHIDLAVTTAHELPTLALDAESISDAVRNLIDNAIKYSPEHAHVDVMLSLNDGRIELTVADEGIGVDPTEAQRIFEPFYRSRRGDRANVHGTGLGLSLVKATVEAHGGTVRVTSDGERGSRFTLAFPVRGDDVQEAGA